MDNVIIYDKLEELNEGIESNGGGIDTLLNGRIVKSAQRGVARNINFRGTYSIPISTVNLDKSILITDYAGDNVSINFTLTSSSINVGYTGINNVSIANVSWQVIEFY